MSEGEIFVTVVSLIIALPHSVGWLIFVLSPTSLHSARAARWPLWFSPLAAIAAIFIILRLFAASDVRDAPQYLVMYTLMGAAWLCIISRFFRLMGLNAADDVALRNNGASGVLFTGAMLGFAAAFAGGNIGDGPGWWVVLFSSGLATLTLFLVWLLLNGAVQATHNIVVERDLGAAIRLGALLTSLGVAFGRGAAGNWHGAPAAATDFLSIAAPALLVLAPELAFGWLFRPTPRSPTSPTFIAGILPAGIYLAATAAYLRHLGWWS